MSIDIHFFGHNSAISKPILMKFWMTIMARLSIRNLYFYLILWASFGRKMGVAATIRKRVKAWVLETLQNLDPPGGPFGSLVTLLSQNRVSKFKAWTTP